eukprot:551409-Pyramimonas_sp.AAC.1
MNSWLTAACTTPGPHPFPVKLAFTSGGLDEATLWMGGSVVGIVGASRQIYGVFTVGHGMDVRVASDPHSSDRLELRVGYKCTAPSHVDRDRMVRNAPVTLLHVTPTCYGVLTMLC